MVAQRGEIWRASLGPPSGARPSKRRPVLVVQHDAFNASNIATVIVAVITRNLRLAAMPGNVELRPRHSGLRQPSVVNCSQLVTLDRRALTERVGAIPAAKMKAVDGGLVQVLGLAG